MKKKTLLATLGSIGAAIPLLVFLEIPTPVWSSQFQDHANEAIAARKDINHKHLRLNILVLNNNRKMVNTRRYENLAQQQVYVQQQKPVPLGLTQEQADIDNVLHSLDEELELIQNKLLQ